MLHLEAIPITSKADSCNIIDKCGDDFDENMESTIDCIQCNRIPCLEDIIANIETNNGDVFQIMQLFADSTGQEAKMDLKIKVKNNIPGNNFARTFIRGGTSNRPTIEIQMNKEMLQNSSELFIHSVFSHELIHAYILYRLRFDVSLFEEESLPIYQLLNNYGQLIPIQTHILISNQYIPVLLNELVENFGTIEFPFAENEYLRHIVWSGLIDFIEESDPNTNSGQMAIQIWLNQYPEDSDVEQDFYFTYYNEGNFNDQGERFDDYGPVCN